MPNVLNKPQKGSLLVAEPFLGDTNFDRTVVLLTEHNEEGSVGFVINKPLELTLDEVVIGFPSFESRIYHGGPVQQDSLFFLHNKGSLIPGGELIKDDLYWGGDLEPLKEMIKLGLIDQENIRFFLGYSGWGGGQLDLEITEKSWLVLEHETIDMFKDTPSEMWKNIMMGVGGSYPLWANSPMDPNLN
ncbi:YqgE/AlgH family protein [Owenweeksia hongkongensis]|uniref:YqgE/AlgH family protein n=1 Tax=Owenweeksia hongkongensis TaxID=253245 RepID=UPI003A8FAE25